MAHVSSSLTRFLARSAFVGAMLLCLPGPLKAEDSPVDFTRDVRPILARSCWECHGATRNRGGLRLTSRQEALKPADSGEAVLVPGKAEQSLLLRRVTAEDDRMPPRGERLGAAQVDLLRRWIDQGAPWPEDTAATRHWAYVRPVRPPLPTVKAATWPRNAIDYFILSRLEKEALAPAPEADRAQLLRRACLDLTGLPPTPAQLDAFLADTAPDAYGRVIEQLLASPQYGERWARPWLDLARYADSNGFQRDGFRDLWAYRDWVVRALNADLPFDRFTTEQIAGDLLPGATLDQQIATGFHRCTPVNVEAGTDQEENRVNQVFDRVNTTGLVWLGTSLECAQCHDHKYDPVTQREYYQLFAFFNNTASETKFRSPQATAAVDFIGPTLDLPDPTLAERRQQLQVERDAVIQKLDPLPVEIAAILRKPAAQRSKAEAQQLEKLLADRGPAGRQLQEQCDRLTDQLSKARPAQTLVMKELAEPRPTHLFRRGNFLDRGEPVQPGVPAAWHPLGRAGGVSPLSAPREADAPRAPTRLDLAQWLVDPANPLTARVTVNRWWAEFFGHGLVSTLEDFGIQGEPPTHPELLDWLAVEFLERGWSMKAIHRLIATSAAYRQASRLTSVLQARDNQNRLYARGPRFRLDAETIRDNALAVAGLLSLKQGGPPVRPYQPDGVWKVTGLVDNTYRISEGEDRYRRGLYVIWRRSAPYPSFMNFDASIRATCVVKRSRSNTPLQALTLLNDPVYVEAALALARRLLVEVPSGVDERIRHAFRLSLARPPAEREAEVVRKLYAGALARYANDLPSARALIGRFPVPEGVAAAELAAWYEVAAVLLNLDETITKG